MLGVLLLVYSAIQTIFALFLVAVVLIYGFSGIAVLLEQKPGSATGGGILLAFVGVFVVLLGIGLTSIILNIRSGLQLRGSVPASKDLLLAASIVNTVSFLGSWVCLAPFGIGLAIFGLIFIFSDGGRAYFGETTGAPPPPNEYGRPANF